MDRTIHFGDDEADARYRIQDTSSTGSDLVLAEDLDGGTVLLEYDYSASEWVSRGPVNLSGNDITNAGSITADSLEADDINNAGSDVSVSDPLLFDSISGDIGAVEIFGSGGNNFVEVTDNFISVDNSATQITQDEIRGLVLVRGDDDSDNRFVDLINVIQVGFKSNFEVVSDITLGTPATRNYSTGPGLQVAVSSGSTKVATYSINGFV